MSQAVGVVQDSTWRVYFNTMVTGGEVCVWGAGLLYLLVLSVYTVPSAPLSDLSYAAGPHILRLSLCRQTIPGQTLTRHRHPSSALWAVQIQYNVRRTDQYPWERCWIRQSSWLHHCKESVPSTLLFLAGSLVIKYEALQENGRLLLDVSKPVLDAVKSWTPVSGLTSQGLNANYSQCGKVLLGSLLQVQLRRCPSKIHHC